MESQICCEIECMEVAPLAEEALFRLWLDRMPEIRRRKVASLRFAEGRRLSLGAGILLFRALEKRGLDGARTEIRENEFGQPCFPDHPDLHFSLSHSGNAVLCALDRHPVGADIEMIRRRSLEHLLSVFSDRERASIEQAASPELCFTRLWTRKESYLKLTGEGLTGTKALREIPTEDTDMVHFETVIREAEDFLYSVCQWTADMP